MRRNEVDDDQVPAVCRGVRVLSADGNKSSASTRRLTRSLKLKGAGVDGGSGEWRAGTLVESATTSLVLHLQALRHGP
jgi:hypothetical protein